jgi:murein DD-endopeptidase MepM/ murein hydrolase activator NlpD
MFIKRVEIKRQALTQYGYWLPFNFDRVEISQGYNGPYSHFAMEKGRGILYDNRFCIDFVLPVGTPVLAAKHGEVAVFKNNSSDYYTGSELERGLQSSSNFILLRHDNDFYTIYSHLTKGSAQVSNGDKVNQGQVIARTGKSGWIGSKPHLHFAVWENKTGRLTSPVIFDDYDGQLEHSMINL